MRTRRNRRHPSPKTFRLHTLIQKRLRVGLGQASSLLVVSAKAIRRTMSLRRRARLCLRMPSRLRPPVEFIFRTELQTISHLGVPPSSHHSYALTASCKASHARKAKKPPPVRMLPLLGTALRTRKRILSSKTWKTRGRTRKFPLQFLGVYSRTIRTFHRARCRHPASKP